MSTNSALERIVTEQNPTTEELLEALRNDGVQATKDQVFRLARSHGVGLARDGKWYHHTQNQEVKEAVDSNRPTFLIDQWFRNR